MANKDNTPGRKIARPHTSNTPQGWESALLTKAQAAAYLGTTERHVQRMWVERRIPAVKVGRKVRFRIRDLEAWIEAHTVPEVKR